jgi:hypothetical protein
MTELKYLDITKAGDGHIKVPSIGLISPAITESIAKTALASFSDGAEGIPVTSLIADINPVQTGSGDPSPSNVRPITGWTGMNVVVSPTLDAQDGTTYPISWADEAGTVYGGTLDVTTGLLTVDMASVDLGTLTWTYYTSGTNPLFSTSSITDSALGVNGVVPNAISSAYTAYASNSRSNLASVLPNGCFSIERGATTFHVRNDAYTSAAAFKTAMSGVQLVYELATPQTYQLTPQAVMTILGQNNIWADTGDVEVAYCADTKMYIDKVIAGL